jgi:adenylate kinase family enzyme
MRRIIILGRTGSGKSVLARLLGKRLCLPVVHLDAIFYGPRWSPPDEQMFKARVAEAIADDRWITDGNFVAATAALRFPRADTIIWLDQPLWLRFVRAIARCIAVRRQERLDLAPGCYDRLDWALLTDIWNFDRIERPKIEAALRQWAPSTSVIRLKGDRAVTSFLESIPLPGV